jgi:hypothetical protein
MSEIHVGDDRQVREALLASDDIKDRRLIGRPLFGGYIAAGSSEDQARQLIEHAHGCKRRRVRVTMVGDGASSDVSKNRIAPCYIS